MIDTNTTIVSGRLTGAVLVPAVLAFCAGIVGDQLWRPDPLVLVACIVPLGVGFFIVRARPNVRTSLLIVLACMAGAVHHAVVIRCLPKDHIAHIVANGRGEATLTAVVTTPPVTRRQEKTFPYHATEYIHTRFIVRAQHVSMSGRRKRTCGLVRVTLPGIHDRYRPGMRVRLTGTLERAAPYVRWPGILSPSPPMGADPNGVWMRIAGAERISIIDRHAGWLAAATHRVRQFAHALLVSDAAGVDADGRSLLSAMVLGKRYEVERTVNRAFLSAGAAHFLAVSGFHLAVLAAATWAMAMAAGLSRRSAACLLLVVVWVYVGINETRPSIVRAAIMATFGCWGMLTGRRGRAINWLAAAAMIVLLINPHQLFNVGFQLSFICVAALILLCPRLHETLFGPAIPRVFMSFSVDTLWGRLKAVAVSTPVFAKLAVTTAISASIVAWAAALPIVMTRFHIISVIGPFTCVVVAPLAVALIVCGFLQLVVTAVIGHPLFFPFLTEFLGMALSKTVGLLAQVPGSSLHVMPPPAIMVVVYYGLLAWLALSPAPARAELMVSAGTLRDRVRRLVRPRLTTTVLLVLIAGYLTWWVAGAYRVAGTSRVIAASRSRGQLVAVQSGSQIVLADCGTAGPGEASDLMAEMSTKYLAAPKAVFLTFPEQRFFNDAPDLAQAFPEVPIYTTRAFESLRDIYGPIGHLFDARLLTGETALSAGSVVRLADMTVTRLHPTRQVVSAVLSAGPGIGEMKGTAMVRRLNELGGAILVETPTAKIVVSSVLGPLACELIRNAYPSLRADALVTYVQTPVGKTLARLIEHAHIRHLILCGRPGPSARRRLEHMCRQLDIRLTVVERSCVVVVP